MLINFQTKFTVQVVYIAWNERTVKNVKGVEMMQQNGVKNIKNVKNKKTNFISECLKIGKKVFIYSWLSWNLIILKKLSCC